MNLGLSENVGLIFPIIAIFHRDNDHWPLGLGVHYFPTVHEFGFSAKGHELLL